MGTGEKINKISGKRDGTAMIEFKKAIFGILLLLVYQELHAFEFMDKSTPDKNFYMENFSQCPKCRTMTIVVSTKNLSEDLIGSFKVIANKLGKDHAASLIKRNKVWEEYQFFNRQGCKPLDKFGKQFVTYIDRDEKFCTSIAFNSEEHLIAVIVLIASNIDNAENIKNEKWRYMAHKSVDNLVEKNPEYSGLKEFAYELIAYAEKLIKKERK